ncbi:MAG TPA: GDSL-type esterase/lipase family protein [Pirellulales bacterium]
MMGIRRIHFAASSATFALLVILSSPTMASPIRMAVMGDSISAGSSGNWVGQLGKSFPGAINFLNSAKGGATTDTVISGQLNTVKMQAGMGQIDDSTLIIGGNNFLSVDALTGILSGNPTPYINNYVNDVKQIIDAIALAGPGVHQVFGNMPDVTVTPEVIGDAAQTDDPALALSLLSSAVVQADALANAYALSHNVPVIDLYTASHTILSGSTFPLGGHTFTTAFASDGFHPAGWVQGLLGNMVDTAYNLRWHQNLPIMSDQQIVRNQGFTPNGLTTYTNVTPLILLPVPEPATWLLALTGVLFSVAHARRRRRS